MPVRKGAERSVKAETLPKLEISPVRKGRKGAHAAGFGGTAVRKGVLTIRKGCNNPARETVFNAGFVKWSKLLY